MKSLEFGLAIYVLTHLINGDYDQAEAMYYGRMLNTLENLEFFGK